MPKRPARWKCPPRSGITIRTLLTKHELFTKTWTASAAYQEFSVLFTHALLKQEPLKINSCMCLYLGNFSADTTSPCYKTHNDSSSQPVAFESWVELLKTKPTVENIYLQDPVFNALDIKFLQRRGFSVIETTGSDDLISLSAFLFISYGEMWGEMRVEVSADPVYPPLYIGNDPRTHSLYYVYSHPDEQGEKNCVFSASSTPEERVAIFPYLQRSVIRPMPQSDAADWLEGLTLYYKPDSWQSLKHVAFEVDDRERFTHEEAEAQWTEL